jgi:hypothetical protein
LEDSEIDFDEGVAESSNGVASVNGIIIDRAAATITRMKT